MSDTYERREGLTIISRGGEYLRFLGGDDGVTRDEFSEDSTGGFDTVSHTHPSVLISALTPY